MNESVKIAFFTAVKATMLIVAMSIFIMSYGTVVVPRLDGVIPEPVQLLLRPTVAVAMGWLTARIVWIMTSRAVRMMAYYAGMTVNSMFDVPVPICWAVSVPDISSGSFIFVPSMVKHEPWSLFRIGDGEIKEEIRFVNMKLYRKFYRMAKKSEMRLDRAGLEALMSLNCVPSMPAPRQILVWFGRMEPSSWPEIGVPEPEALEDAQEFREELTNIVNRVDTLRRFDMVQELDKTIRSRMEVQFQSESNKAVTRQLVKLAESLKMRVERKGE